MFDKDGKSFLIILSQNQTDKAGSYRHIVLFEREKNAKGIAITSGKFVVSDILNWDNKNDAM